MTPTATYIAEENCLQEISDYAPPPDRPDVRYYSSSQQDMYQRHLEAWQIVMQSYNANKTKYEEALRKIPCDTSCKGLWKDQQRVVEGKHYEIKECRTWTQKGGEWGCSECCWGDRCDEDCDATYRRPNCPFCKGKGWFKEQPLFAFPLVPVKSEDEDALWRDVYAEAEAAIDWQYQEINDKKLIAILKSKYIITKR